MAVTRPSFNARTKQIVYTDDGASPYVGFENPDEHPEGWEYNIKRWCSLFDLRLPNLPRLADPSTQGVSESTYFKSGVGAKNSGDLYIDKIDEKFRNNERNWVPIIRNGEYFRFKTPFFLYSDSSRIQYIDTLENRDGRNYLELDTEPDMNSPILAASFIRHPITRTPYYDIKVNQRAEFSGIFVDGEEQETVTDVGKILWDNIDYNKREFIIDNTIDGVTSLKFNRDFIELHGIPPVSFQDLAASELLGMSNGSNYQTYYLSHFPVIADDSFHLYVVGTSTWNEWERVNSWFDLINMPHVYTGGNKYFLDKDLGIIYFGSSVQGGVPTIGEFIVVVYNSTIRVEYEKSNTNSTITGWEADTSPLVQHINQGFVVITHDQLEAANIVLDINKSSIPFTTDPVEHGPVYIGADYGVLRATVTSSGGVIVPGIEVGFEMTPANIGTLTGGTDAVSITNGRGEAFSSYQPPVSADVLGFYSSVVRTSNKIGYTTTHKDIILNTTQSGLDGKESEVYIFQILKDDILLGYNTVDEFIYQTLEFPSWVVDATSYARWRTEILLDYEIKDWEEINMDLPFTSPYKTLSGRKVVVYKINPTTENVDSTAINPITGTLEAIVPVRPDFIEQIDDSADTYNNLCRIIYPKDAVPDCDPDDTGNNVGGYWVVSSRLVKFRASCLSPYHNRVIYSNEITVRISLPQYMVGEYINNLIQKVPFGWKLPTDTDNIAAGMDGATYITINPHSGPYNIIDLVNGITSEEWADAPFNSIGLQFNIELP